MKELIAAFRDVVIVAIVGAAAISTLIIWVVRG